MERKKEKCCICWETTFICDNCLKCKEGLYCFQCMETLINDWEWDGRCAICRTSWDEDDDNLTIGEEIKVDLHLVYFL
jgi:hypothetical protein